MILNSDLFFSISTSRKTRDKCDFCRLYETSSLEARANIEEQYLEHLERKDHARAAKNFDMAIAKDEFQRFNDGTILERTFICLEIDFEKTLAVPCCSRKRNEICEPDINFMLYLLFLEAYYSVLAVYHLTLIDIGSGEVYSFIYDETQGKKCEYFCSKFIGVSN